MFDLLFVNYQFFISVHGCQVKIDRAGLILLLLANGVKIDVKTTDEGLSSFMIACIMGDVQLAELLLARGASIHNTDKESKRDFRMHSVF